LRFEEAQAFSLPPLPESSPTGRSLSLCSILEGFFSRGEHRALFFFLDAFQSVSHRVPIETPSIGFPTSFATFRPLPQDEKTDFVPVSPFAHPFMRRSFLLDFFQDRNSKSFFLSFLVIIGNRGIRQVYQCNSFLVVVNYNPFLVVLRGAAVGLPRKRPQALAPGDPLQFAPFEAPRSPLK